jgi:hypothetical protein
VLASALEAEGVSVWWDRRLRPGQSFDEVIEDALASAKETGIGGWSDLGLTLG